LRADYYGTKHTGGLAENTFERQTGPIRSLEDLE